MAALAFSLAIAPVVQPTTAAAAEAAEANTEQSIDDFYAARDGRPLWLQTDGTGFEAAILIDLLRSADVDGLDPDRYRPDDLSRALDSAADGSPAAVRRADFMLSEAFVAFARDLRRTPKVDIVWVDPELKPKPPSPRALLEAAADAPSLGSYVEGMRWMHPIYAGLRQALAAHSGSDSERQLLRLNLERARALPSGGQRHVIVNATAAQLIAYEGGEVVDSMRVVVGKPKNPTPMMAAYIRYTALNPYWNVPADLTAERIAPNVLKDGLFYLYDKGYQVLSDWSDRARIVDPATIDWQSVADGRLPIRVRQLPGPANSMGQMKFMFPNAQGVYLHDTPDRELMTEPARMFSGGCVRLEDAPRLATWMYGRPLESSGAEPEQRVDLPKPLPVFITYLTMVPSGAELATFPDVYGRDRKELASLGPSLLAGR